MHSPNQLGYVMEVAATAVSRHGGTLATIQYQTSAVCRKSQRQCPVIMISVRIDSVNKALKVLEEIGSPLETIKVSPRGRNLFLFDGFPVMQGEVVRIILAVKVS